VRISCAPPAPRKIARAERRNRAIGKVPAVREGCAANAASAAVDRSLPLSMQQKERHLPSAP